MKRDRGWRREQVARKQKARVKVVRHSIGAAVLEDPARLGRLKKNHFGCGCPLCKPWKHGRK